MVSTAPNSSRDYIGYDGYDDDENSLVHRLIKKEDLNECYRIMFQLLKRKKEDCVWNFIIKVFLDFYAELNPKLENFIFKLKKEQESGQGQHQQHHSSKMTFVYIIKNMFIRTSISHNVYNARIRLRTYKHTIQSQTIHKMKNNESLDLLICEPDNSKYAVLIRALHSKNIDKVAYKLSTHLKDGVDVDMLHRIIIRYFSRVYFNFESEEINEPNVGIFEKWLQIKKNIPRTFYFHYLLTIVIHLFTKEKDINGSLQFVKPNPDIIPDN